MIYGILSTIVFFIILPFWLIAGIFKPKLTAGLKEKMGFYKNFKPLKNPIIFYGVSVGENLAMENLIKKTKETFPNQDVVVMTGTNTGQAIAHKKFDNVVDYITYFPLDFPMFINKMLKKFNPKAIVIMETELWPNFANITNKKGIKTFIINARISDRTFNSYKKLQFIFESILKKYTNIFPQSKQDCEKFISLGANPETTQIMGNLKFDIKKPDTTNLNFEKKPEHKIILAGSTHNGEDEIILDVFSEIKKENNNAKLIIASRHPERNEHVFSLMKKTGLNVSKRSENANFSDNEIILLDTMGELGKMYSICDIAFLGGSFDKTGGHNPLEATIFSKPVISGPCFHNFKDIYAILQNAKAAKIVQTSDELKSELTKLLSDEQLYKQATSACEKVFEDNRGALTFVIDVLQKLV